MTKSPSECKGYSRFIQIIWGHWVVGKSSNSSTEGIFSQRVFMDSLEKVKKKARINTSKSTSTITTKEATTIKTTKISKRSKTTAKAGKSTTLKPENTECLFADKRAAQSSTTKKYTASSAIPKLPANIVKKLNSIQENLGDVLKALANYGTTKVIKFKRFATVAPPHVSRHAKKLLHNNITERLDSLDRRLSKFFNVHKLLKTQSRKTERIMTSKAPK